MKTICTICARGGSVGVPRKNIRMLDGKPLIAHTIQTALACPSIDAIYVSTDDEEIAKIAAEWGANVPFLRPAELATSASGKLPVIEHLVTYVADEGVEFDRVVDLDPTSPLRTVEDVENALAMLNDDTDVVITAYEADKSPYFNMVEAREDGNIGLVKPLEQGVLTRQSAPKVYSMNASIYVWHKNTLDKGLWNGRTRLYEMPRNRSIDIDSEIDFKLVQMLMNEAKGQSDDA